MVVFFFSLGISLMVFTFLDSIENTRQSKICLTQHTDQG
jgi:hypothetical protein